MVVSGMCDVSPDFATPVRGYDCVSRLGLLVSGTVDDPIDVQSTAKRYKREGIASFGTRQISEGSSSTLDLASYGRPSSKPSVSLGQTSAYNVDRKSAEFSGCIDWGSISTDEDEPVIEHNELPKRPSAPFVSRDPTPAPKQLATHENLRDEHGCSPIRITPAKKPKVTLRMRNAVDSISHTSDSNGAGVMSPIEPKVSVTAVMTRACDVPPLVSAKVESSKTANNVPRWKSLRHKVLLRLRKKQAHNNYDLAMFLLLKFGGPDTNAGRSILRDASLLACSSLNRYSSEREMKLFYLRERTALTALLSQRMALNTLTPAQLHRKLAKLLPPNRWFNRPKLLQKVKDQEQWNPFSIFGSSLPYVSISEVFGLRGSTTTNPALCTDQTANSTTTPAFDGKCGGCACRVQGVDVTPGINWSSDPLMLDEVLWYLEATGKYVDKSPQVCTLQRCYCVTPDPHIAFNWNDARSTAWREYHGPRASMGQLLSPSIYEESLQDHEKLCNELKVTLSDGHLAPSDGTVDINTATDKGLKITSNNIGDTRKESNNRVSFLIPRTSSESGTGESVVYAILTPKTRRIKEQKLVFYRNYFNANQITALRGQVISPKLQTQQ
ncbi:hypothetical protein BaOVIS_021140 [Babesia ovis]|uniref:Uncharacterized protein n=1 Tax=Babesia ovis TaxID=5869 RepID=A0A9W5TC10_BABOV|nr:hypothetical protein BaOVIS_021140 [Babesia ovis]